MFFNRSDSTQELADLCESKTNLADAAPGEQTICYHFQIHSNLGWIQWKDREASLYTAFGATKCELKIAESMDEFSMEIEIPRDQEEKFLKSFKAKSICREIDRIHGIDTVVCMWSDCRLSRLKSSAGSTLAYVPVSSSCEVLQRRLERLEQCSFSRNKEVDAIRELAKTIMFETKRKVELLDQRVDMKVYENCGVVFELVEDRIMQTLRDDLMFLGTPLLFKHPEGIKKSDTGIPEFVKFMQETAKKPAIPSKQKSIATTPVHVQYLEEASSRKFLFEICTSPSNDAKLTAESDLSNTAAKPTIFVPETPSIHSPQSIEYKSATESEFESPTVPQKESSKKILELPALDSKSLPVLPTSTEPFEFCG